MSNFFKRLRALFLFALILPLLGGCGGDDSHPQVPAPVTITLPADGLQGSWVYGLGTYPYAIQHLKGTDTVNCRAAAENTLTVTFEVDSRGFISENPAAHWAVALRNDAERLDGLTYEPGTSRISTGHGIAVGKWGAGSPNFTYWTDTYYAPVVEFFNKGPGELTLAQWTLGAILDDTLRHRYEVTSRVSGGAKSIQYRVWSREGDEWVPLFDSGQVEDTTAFDPQRQDITFSSIFFDPVNHAATSPVVFTNIQALWECP